MPTTKTKKPAAKKPVDTEQAAVVAIEAIAIALTRIADAAEANAKAQAAAMKMMTTMADKLTAEMSKYEKRGHGAKRFYV